MAWDVLSRDVLSYIFGTNQYSSNMQAACIADLHVPNNTRVIPRLITKFMAQM